jgi:hypothetical protein
MAKSRDDSLFRKCETRFIFLGTPHRGSPMTSLARLWSLLGYWSGSSLSLLEVMESGSKENDDLHDLFLMDHGQNEIVNYYEVEPERWGELQITTVRNQFCHRMKILPCPISTNKYYRHRLFRKNPHLSMVNAEITVSLLPTGPCKVSKIQRILLSFIYLAK